MGEAKRKIIEITTINLSSVLKNLLPTVFIFVFILLFFCGLVILNFILKLVPISDVEYLNDIGLTAGGGFWVVVLLSFLYSIILSLGLIFLILLVMIFYNIFAKVVGGIKFEIKEHIDVTNSINRDKGELRKGEG